MDFAVHVQQSEQRRDPHGPRERPGEPIGPNGFPLPHDDSKWDAFIPDDDELDPLPEPGDFWIEPPE